MLYENAFLCYFVIKKMKRQTLKMDQEIQMEEQELHFVAMLI